MRVTHRKACFLPIDGREGIHLFRQECLWWPSWTKLVQRVSAWGRSDRDRSPLDEDTGGESGGSAAVYCVPADDRPVACRLSIARGGACSPPMLWSSACNQPEPQGQHHPDLFLRVKMRENASWAHSGIKQMCPVWQFGWGPCRAECVKKRNIIDRRHKVNW